MTQSANQKASGSRSLIQQCRVASVALLGVTLVSLGASQYMSSRVSMGGPMHVSAQASNDLIADILPPPAYVIEPFLETNLALRHPASAEGHIARLAALRAEYEARRDHWQASALPEEIRAEIGRATGISDRFWREVDSRFIPAMRAGNSELAASILDRRLTPLFNDHDTAIRELVETATEHKQSIDAAAASALMWSRLMAGFNFVVMLLAILLGGRYLVKRGLGPIMHATSELERGLGVLSDGDLTVRLKSDFPESYATLRDSFEKTIGNLGGMLRQVSDSSGNVNVASAEIRAASIDLSDRTEKQAMMLQETSASMDHITGTVNQTAKSAGEVRSTVDGLSKLAENGRGVVTNAIDAMGAIQRSASEITQIIALIDSIAFQTNLLALNAGVEAARAGDAGKGFAVVANEVRALAQRSAEAAKNITALITGSADQVNRGVGLVDESGQVFEKIVKEMVSITVLVDEIAASSGKEAEELVKLNQDIANLHQETQQNAAMSEQSSAAAVSLAMQAASLGKLVSQFRIEDDTPQAQAAEEQTSGDEPLPFVSLSARRRAHPAPAASNQAAPSAPTARPAASRPVVSGNLAVKDQDDWTEF